MDVKHAQEATNRREVGAQATRSEILGAAKRLFAAHGYALDPLTGAIS